MSGWHHHSSDRSARAGRNTVHGALCVETHCLRGLPPTAGGRSRVGRARGDSCSARRARVGERTTSGRCPADVRVRACVPESGSSRPATCARERERLPLLPTRSEDRSARTRGSDGLPVRRSVLVSELLSAPLDRRRDVEGPRQSDLARSPPLPDWAHPLVQVSSNGLRSARHRTSAPPPRVPARCCPRLGERSPTDAPTRE